MKLFDKNGIMIIPVPEKLPPPRKDMIVVKECYCPNGHSLISRQARFNDRDGIVLGVVKKKNVKGRIALSPVYGDKSRVNLDIELVDGELLELVCPHCHIKLPSYAACECGGELVVMFTRPEADFNNCIGICNRVGCKHSEIKNEGQLMTLIRNE
jgi:hypothetical protein